MAHIEEGHFFKTIALMGSGKEDIEAVIDAWFVEYGARGLNAVKRDALAYQAQLTGLHPTRKRILDYCDLVLEREKIKSENTLKVLELQPKSIESAIKSAEASIKFGEESEKTNEKIAGFQRIAVWMAGITTALVLVQAIVFYLQLQESRSQSKILRDQLQVQIESASHETKFKIVHDTVYVKAH